MQKDKFQSYFSYTIPYKPIRFNGFLQKSQEILSVEIVQNELGNFVEYSGFVNLYHKCPFSSGLFIDILLKNCILIIS